MGDVSGTGGPQRPHWQPNSGNPGQGSKPDGLEPKLGTDSFQSSGAQPGATPSLGGLGDAARALGNLGGQAVSKVGKVAGDADDKVTRSIRTALHAIFDPSSNGDAVRLAVANQDAKALEAALKAKRPDGTDAWDQMDARTRKLLASTDPGIRLGLAAMIGTPQMKALIAKIKADPKAAKEVSHRIDRLNHKQAHEAVKGIEKMKKNPNEGLKAASQLDGYYSASSSVVNYCNI